MEPLVPTGWRLPRCLVTACHEPRELRDMTKTDSWRPFRRLGWVWNCRFWNVPTRQEPKATFQKQRQSLKKQGDPLEYRGDAGLESRTCIRCNKPIDAGDEDAYRESRLCRNCHAQIDPDSGPV